MKALKRQEVEKINMKILEDIYKENTTNIYKAK